MARGDSRIVKDTSRDVAERFRGLLLALPGEERLAMGCRMFQDAKALALAGLRAEHPRADAREIERLLFKRLYGGDFSPARMDKILRELR